MNAPSACTTAFHLTTMSLKKALAGVLILAKLAFATTFQSMAELSGQSGLFRRPHCRMSEEPSSQWTGARNCGSTMSGTSNVACFGSCTACDTRRSLAFILLGTAKAAGMPFYHSTVTKKTRLQFCFPTLPAASMNPR